MTEWFGLLSDALTCVGGFGSGCGFWLSISGFCCFVVLAWRVVVYWFAVCCVDVDVLCLSSSRLLGCCWLVVAGIPGGVWF